MEGNAPLKHKQNKQWMWDQSPSNCKLSAKVSFLNNPDLKEDEEE